MTSWQAIPKVELHVHLDASMSYAVASRLRPGLSEERHRADFVAPARCRTLPELIQPIVNAVALMQDEQGLRLATRDLCEQLCADHVIYAEVRFAPLLHARGGLAPDTVVSVVADELRAAAPRLDARLLLCTLRHFSEAESRETARLAVAHAARGVVGLDLAGDEAGFSLDPHVAAFEHARASGLGLTAHAGEALGPSSVRETLHRLRPSRIGHGVRASEDPAVVRELADRGVHLEVCPSSNVQLGLFADVRAHPLAELRARGVSVGVNTDGRTINALTLSEEYARVASAYGWAAEDFRACNLAALAAAFISDDDKRALRQRLAS